MTCPDRGVKVGPRSASLGRQAEPCKDDMRALIQHRYGAALRVTALAAEISGCGPTSTTTPTLRPSETSPPSPITSSPRSSSTSTAPAPPVRTTSSAQSPAEGSGGPDPLRSKDAERATAAVLALPGVKGLCAESLSRGASGCGAFATEAPSEPCKDGRFTYVNRSCWWAVGLFETMSYPDGEGDHANRMATFYVDPATFEVKGASTFECADLLFTLPAMRALKTRKSPPQNEDDFCAGALAFPSP